MNVQEQQLREKIDPFLKNDILAPIAGQALGMPVTVRGSRVHTVGCWNRVLAVETSEMPESYYRNGAAANAKFIREHAR